MMDEQLIDEVAQHAVIFNRQKYYLNGSTNGSGPVTANKYETKDEAWSSIAMKLRSDVETCKKRWKYLRERYVSQRKQGDPPVYEHLSRPYLEKMKFLDSHIQPRKSYRNVPNFLTSPHSANSSNFNDYNMDSKSNSSLKSMGHFGQHGHHFPDQQHAMNALSSAAAAASALDGESRVKLEADQVFRDFAAAVASQHLQQISQSQMQHQQSVAAALAVDSSQNYNDNFREGTGPVLSSVVGGVPNMNGSSAGGNATSGLHSSPSSIKSPLSSPLRVSIHHNGTGTGHASLSAQQVAAHSSAPNTPNNATASTNTSSHNFNNHSFNDSHNDDMDSSTSSNYNMKKPRVQLNDSVTNMSASSQQHQNSNHHNSHNNLNNSTHFVDDSDDDDTDDNSSSLLQPQGLLNEHHSAENPFQTMSASTSGAALQRSHSNSSMNNQNNTNNHNTISHNPSSSNMFSSNADFLFQLYQQLPQHNQQQHNSNVSPTQQFKKFQVPSTPQPTVQRSSEHLLGELVTTELLKMSKEKRKNVQKRILEILFFDD